MRRYALSRWCQELRLGVRHAVVVLLVLLGVPGEAMASPLAPLGPVVDANPAGQAAIAWTRPDGVRVTTVDPTGGTTTATLATTSTATGARVAIDDAGEVVVVWETQRVTRSFPCHGCSASVASEGVFAALGRVGAGFGVPVRLAGPLPDPDAGAGDRLADPLLTMDAQGRAVVVGSAWIASRAPGSGFGTPTPASVMATDAALGHDGEVLLTDVSSRVVTRAPGAAFGTPAPLPGANTPYGPGAMIAADAAGDAVALYRGSSSVVASRRAPDGSWGTPTALTAVNGAAGRAIKVAGDGTAVALFAQPDRNPANAALMATTLHPDGSATTAQINAVGTDGDVAAGDLDADDAGRFAFAYTQEATRFGPKSALVALLQPDGTFVGPAALNTAFQFGDAARVALSGDRVLATWTQHAGGEVRLLSRWLPGGPTLTLDHVPAFTFTPPKPALQLTAQPVRHPDRRGRILVGLRCVSADRSSCTGTLRLIAGPQRWTAGHTSYAIGPNAVHRTRIALSVRARRTLRRQGHLALAVRGVRGHLLVRAALTRHSR